MSGRGPCAPAVRDDNSSPPPACPHTATGLSVPELAPQGRRRLGQMRRYRVGGHCLALVDARHCAGVMP